MCLSFCVLIRLSWALVSIWSTHRLTFSKACSWSAQYGHSWILRPSVFISPRPSFIPSVTLHLSWHPFFFYPPSLSWGSYLPSSVYVRSICLSLQGGQHFHFSPSAPTPIAPSSFGAPFSWLLFQSNASLLYWSNMLFSPSFSIWWTIFAIQN